jgi:hypothetical protein
MQLVLLQVKNINSTLQQQTLRLESETVLLLKKITKANFSRFAIGKLCKMKSFKSSNQILEK